MNIVGFTHTRTRMLFTKESGGIAHSRGGEIRIGDKTRAKIHLDMLEILVKKRRTSILQDFCREKMKASSIEDVVLYIKKVYVKEGMT